MKFKQVFLAVLTVFSLALTNFSVHALQNPFADTLQNDKFPPAEQVFQLDYTQVDAILQVSFDISDGFYMYQHRFDFTPAEKLHTPLQLPEGEHYSDQFFGDTVIYRDRVELEVHLNAAARNEVLTVHFQGCADDGFCYPPSTQQIFLRRTVGTVSTNPQGNETNRSANIKQTVEKPNNWLWFVLLALSLVGFGLARWIRKK